MTAIDNWILELQQSEVSKRPQPLTSTVDTAVLALRYIESGATEPTGPASGDLGGNYPNPTVVQTHLQNGLVGTPSLAFAGDTTTGFYFLGAGSFGIALGGVEEWFFTGSLQEGALANSAAIRNIAATATVPTLIPNKSDTKAGIGANAAGAVSIIADVAGVATECARADTTGNFSSQTQIPLTLKNIQTFSTSATYTPSAGVSAIIIKLWGAGAGSGGVVGTAAQVAASKGASAGSYSEAWIKGSANISAQTVTIGAAGTGGAIGNNNGTNGGASSFGSLVTTNGGNLGTAAVASATFATSNGTAGASIGAVSAPATAIILAPGGDGGPSLDGVTGGLSGYGGASFGFSSIRGIGNAGTGVAALGYGCGASGALTTGSANQAGANGFAGYCIVEEYG